MIFVPSDKPQCRHHNDADNCLLCGTKRLREKAYNVNLDRPLRSQRELQQSFQPTYCRKHKMDHPCIACEAASMIGSEAEHTRRRTVENINATSRALWDEVRKSEHAARWPGGKCTHGHYLSESYCHVCSLALIDPDYDPYLYRNEINKALGNAKRVLGGVDRDVRNSVRDEKGNLLMSAQSEREKNFADVEMMVDIEIWKAVKKYGNEMNGGLAYTVARNTAQKYLADLIAEQTIFVGLDLEFATPRDREDAARLLQQCEDEQALELMANDKDADPEDRKTAQRLIKEYGVRVSRVTSIDVMVQDENGEEGDVSAAELEIHEGEERAAGCAPDVAETFEDNRVALAALVATWRGDKRKVGEAMLKPNFSVRNVPGLNKSKVSRLYQVVVREFKVLISKAVTK